MHMAIMTGEVKHLYFPLVKNLSYDVLKHKNKILSTTFLKTF